MDSGVCDGVLVWGVCGKRAEEADALYKKRVCPIWTVVKKRRERGRVKSSFPFSFFLGHESPLADYFGLT
jgi:hypothetical protein